MSFKIISKHFTALDPVISTHIPLLNERILAQNLDSKTYFSKLCQEIISQQLSVKVADVIGQRFEKLFADEGVSPAQLLKISDEKLRKAGLSGAKTKYLKDLAAKVVTGELNLAALPILENEAVITELIKVKGIGRWTAEMFLIFTLGREDVFSFGDLGLRQSLIKLYNLPPDLSIKLLEPKITEIVAKWSPYQSYGCLALWATRDKVGEV